MTAARDLRGLFVAAITAHLGDDPIVDAEASARLIGAAEAMPGGYGAAIGIAISQTGNLCKLVAALHNDADEDGTEVSASDVWEFLQATDRIVRPDA